MVKAGTYTSFVYRLSLLERTIALLNVHGTNITVASLYGIDIDSYFY